MSDCLCSGADQTACSDLLSGNVHCRYCGRLLVTREQQVQALNEQGVVVRPAAVQPTAEKENRVHTVSGRLRVVVRVRRTGGLCVIERKTLCDSPAWADERLFDDQAKIFCEDQQDDLLEVLQKNPDLWPGTKSETRVVMVYNLEIRVSSLCFSRQPPDVETDYELVSARRLVAEC